MASIALSICFLMGHMIYLPSPINGIRGEAVTLLAGGPASWFLKLVSLLHSEHFVQSGRPFRQRTNSWVFGKEDKPVFYRKGLLFPGSGCSQLLGLLG